MATEVEDFLQKYHFENLRLIEEIINLKEEIQAYQVSFTLDPLSGVGCGGNSTSIECT